MAKAKAEKKKWYDDGIQFECQGSGKCCQSRGQYGFVYLTEDDAKNAAKALKMTTEKFKEQYCRREEGVLCLVDATETPDCIFLNGNRCSIYMGRPTQCKTWPFWPEVMHPKSWNKSVVQFCPGVDKGRTYSKQEIETILAEQAKSDRDIRNEYQKPKGR